MRRGRSPGGRGRQGGPSRSGSGAGGVVARGSRRPGRSGSRCRRSASTRCTRARSPRRWRNASAQPAASRPRIQPSSSTSKAGASSSRSISPEFVSPTRSAGPRRQRCAQCQAPRRGRGSLRPVTRLGTCMAPSASGAGRRHAGEEPAARLGCGAQRGAGAGAAASARPCSRPLTAGRAGDAVLSWWGSPCPASARASSPLGGVARNSESATRPAPSARSGRAMRGGARPPPARMFQKTTRIRSPRYLSSQTSWSRQQL